MTTTENITNPALFGCCGTAAITFLGQELAFAATQPVNDLSGEEATRTECILVGVRVS